MCGQPFVYTHQEGRYLAQCAQCGMALSGPYQGVQHIDKTGKPDLSIGVSHGLCKDCADTILLRWRSKKRRLTKNLAS